MTAKEKKNPYILEISDKTHKEDIFPQFIRQACDLLCLYKFLLLSIKSKSP